MSHNACSMPLIALSPMTPTRQKLAIHLLIDVLNAPGVFADHHRREVLNRASNGPGLPSRLASPHTHRPSWFVSTLTNTQLRICAFTITVFTAVMKIDMWTGLKATVSTAGSRRIGDQVARMRVMIWFAARAPAYARTVM